MDFLAKEKCRLVFMVEQKRENQNASADNNLCELFIEMRMIIGARKFLFPESNIVA